MKTYRITAKTWDANSATLSVRPGLSVYIGRADGRVHIGMAVDTSLRDCSQLSVSVSRKAFMILCKWILSVADKRWRDKSTKPDYKSCEKKIDERYRAIASLWTSVSSGKYVRSPSLIVRTDEFPEIFLAMGHGSAWKIANWYVNKDVPVLDQVA